MLSPLEILLKKNNHNKTRQKHLGLEGETVTTWHQNADFILFSKHALTIPIPPILTYWPRRKKMSQHFLAWLATYKGNEGCEQMDAKEQKKDTAGQE